MLVTNRESEQVHNSRCVTRLPPENPRNLHGGTASPLPSKAIKRKALSGVAVLPPSCRSSGLHLRTCRWRAVVKDF